MAVVLDTLLQYLASALPATLYSFLVRCLSHSIAAATAISTLWFSLLGKDPADWNAQTLLPPIITILAAYLALTSLYRTATWALRLTFWFIKWGTILGVLLAGVGYFMGSGMNGVRDPANYLGAFVAGQAGARQPQKHSTTNHKPAKRLRPWDSFERHREWRYQENNIPQDPADEVQQLISMVTDTAGHILGGTDWWAVAKSVVVSGEEGRPADDTQQTKKASGKPRSQGRAGSSRSR